MKGRSGRASGGSTEGPKAGDKEWEEDVKSKPQRYNNAPKIQDEAEKRKNGGRTGRKSGGHVLKEVGPIKGGKPSPHAGRAPRKAGGRAGSNFSPFSSARSGTNPKGHSTPGNTD